MNDFSNSLFAQLFIYHLLHFCFRSLATTPSLKLNQVHSSITPILDPCWFLFSIFIVFPYFVLVKRDFLHFSYKTCEWDFRRSWQFDFFFHSLFPVSFHSSTSTLLLPGLGYSPISQIESGAFQGLNSLRSLLVSLFIFILFLYHGLVKSSFKNSSWIP